MLAKDLGFCGTAISNGFIKNVNPQVCDQFREMLIKNGIMFVQICMCPRCMYFIPRGSVIHMYVYTHTQEHIHMYTIRYTCAQGHGRYIGIIY